MCSMKTIIAKWRKAVRGFLKRHTSIITLIIAVILLKALAAAINLYPQEVSVALNKLADIGISALMIGLAITIILTMFLRGICEGIKECTNDVREGVRDVFETTEKEIGKLAESINKTKSTKR